MNPTTQDLALLPRAPPQRAVVIHGYAHGLAALDAARAARSRKPGGRAPGGQAPVRLVLLSAPGAAGFLGAGWWLALTTALAGRMAGCDAAERLDCGAAAGRAMEALRLGLRRLILSSACPQWACVSARAAALGASLDASRPEALDLAEPGAERRLPRWLAGGAAGDK